MNLLPWAHWRDRLATEREARRFARLVNEVSAPETLSTMLGELVEGKRTRDDALNELVALLVERKGIAAVLERRGYGEDAAKAKLINLYRALLLGGVGNVGGTFAPAAALYTPRLLDMLLDAQANGCGNEVIAIMAYDYCAGTDLLGFARKHKIDNPSITVLLILSYADLRGRQG